MKRHFLPLISVMGMMGLLLSSCVTQSWDIKGGETKRYMEVERPPESPAISLYIPEYLTEGPSFAKHIPSPPPHTILAALKGKIEGQGDRGLFKVTRSPPETGVFCSIRLEEIEQLAMAGVLSVLSSFSLWLIPAYDSSLGYHIRYDLFVDAKLKKRSDYQVHGKQLEWAAAFLAIPFMSGRWQVMGQPHENVNDDLLQDIWLTLNSFWEEARRDGGLH